MQQGAYYNLGNTQFRLGQKTEKSNPKETIGTWEKAVSSYDAALQIEPGDLQAKHNRDLVQNKIEQLKKQEDQKKQQQDQKQPDQKNDPKNQQAGQNGQEPKDQQRPDQAQNGRPGPAKPEPPNSTDRKPSRGQPEVADGRRPEPGESVDAGSERREPGQMTKDEAQQLLDALKNDEHKLPAASMSSRTAGQPDDQQPPLKDW